MAAATMRERKQRQKEEEKKKKLNVTYHKDDERTDGNRAEVFLRGQSWNGVFMRCIEFICIIAPVKIDYVILHISIESNSLASINVLIKYI